jgi:hypothetical protein
MAEAKDRPIEWVTENWFVYKDDPISLLYTDEDGTVRRVKFAKREYAEKHFTADELEVLRKLRGIYPDEAVDWWMHYEEIRQKLFELFAGNEKFLALLMPLEKTVAAPPPEAAKRTEAKEQQPARDAQPVTAAAPAVEHAAEEGADAVTLIRRDIEAGNEEAKYALMEALDEQQIIDYLENRLVTDYFYEFTVGGSPVIGISYAGTIQAAKVVSAEKKAMGGGIEVLPDVVIEDIKDDRDIEKWGAYVRAVDHSINFTVMGYADQSKMRWNKKLQRWEADPFARRSVVSKATRNALRQLIPEKKILEMYREYKKEKEKKEGKKEGMKKAVR